MHEGLHRLARAATEAYTEARRLTQVRYGDASYLFVVDEERRLDPALGSGPLTTVVQDVLSPLIYFLIASHLIF